jgi:CRISPR-associated endonuclease/helicase Cas3
VLVPADGDLAPRLKHAQDAIGPERAYANVLAVEAARRQIAAGATWTIPADNRRLVEEGTHPQRLQELADELGGAWRKHWSDTYGTQSQHRSHAKALSLDFHEPFDGIRWPEAAERVATRLGAADLLLPLDGPMTSPFGPTLTHLKVPHWMAPGELPADALTLAVESDGRLRLGDRRYTYDRYGLQLARENRG